MRQNRKPDQLRPIQFKQGFQTYPDASVLLSVGKTLVHAAASIKDGVPSYMRGKGGGWLTAEYAMLPTATHSRNDRDANRRSPNGRSIEIQRLIGRSLRQSIHLKALGERTITIDCDVLQADGGTRTASITAGYVALQMLLQKKAKSNMFQLDKLQKTDIAAISLGVVMGEQLLDLDYAEDSQADVDMNLVANSHGEIIELQLTAEQKPLSAFEMQDMLIMGISAIQNITKAQQDFLAQSL